MSDVAPKLRVKIYWLKVDPLEVVRLYREGLSCAAIGEELGCSNVWAWKLLQGLGEPMRFTRKARAA